MVSAEGLCGSQPPIAAPVTQYGVTKPISMAGPTVADIQRSRDLEKVYVGKYRNFFLFGGEGIVDFIYLFMFFCLFCVEICLQFLVEAGLYESKEEASKREQVLGRIQEVIACNIFFPSRDSVGAMLPTIRLFK